MVQPAARIRSWQEASDAARGLESPVEVELFESLASGSDVVRAFLETAEWDGIKHRIMGDGKPPTGRAKSAWDVARFLRWAADGAWSPDEPITAEARRAYLHSAREIESYARTEAGAAVPVSPAPAVQGHSAVSRDLAVRIRA